MFGLFYNVCVPPCCYFGTNPSHTSLPHLSLIVSLRVWTIARKWERTLASLFTTTSKSDAMWHLDRELQQSSPSSVDAQYLTVYSLSVLSHCLVIWRWNCLSFLLTLSPVSVSSRRWSPSLPVPRSLAPEIWPSLLPMEPTRKKPRFTMMSLRVQMPSQFLRNRQWLPQSMTLLTTTSSALTRECVGSDKSEGVCGGESVFGSDENWNVLWRE